MVRQTHGIRLRLLAGVAVVVGALSWIALKLWTNAGQLLPQANWAGLPLLVAFAVGLYLVGRPVKRLVAGKATTSVDPLYAARVLVLAQAAALSGAAVLGWYVAQILLLLPDSDIPSQQGRLFELGVLCLGAILLSAAGLLVQRMCRIDDDTDRRDDEDEDEPGPHHH